MMEKKIIAHFIKRSQNSISLILVTGVFTVGVITCKINNESNNGEIIINISQSKTGSNGMCGSVTAPYLLDLGSATIRDRIGNSHISITTNSEKAQEWFDQGLCLLHDFWSFEAYRSFLESVKSDSLCPMPYWGIALSLPNGIEEVKDIRNNAIKNCHKLRGNANPFENDLIIMLDFLGENFDLEGLKVYMDKLYRKYPDNNEITLLYLHVLFWMGNSEFNAMKKITENGIQTNPKNISLAHYYIHIMERTEEYEKALPQVKLILDYHPNVAHLFHSTGHIYFRMGELYRAIDVFKKADSFDQSYHKNEGISYIENEQYLHNLHYLAISLLENNNISDAMIVARRYADLQFASSRKSARTALMWNYEGVILPAIIQMRIRNWGGAIYELQNIVNMTYGIQNKALLEVEALLFFCKGMQSLESADIKLAVENIQLLTQKLDQIEKNINNNKDFGSYLSFNLLQCLYIYAYELQGWIKNMDVSKPFDFSDFTMGLEIEKNIGYTEPPKMLYSVYESMALLLELRGDVKESEKFFKKACLSRKGSKLIKNCK